ncbi:MAG: hypothetical protein COB96_00360 [Planctomycetota bacterium]|nr:MAG: hypothetical protein COB96_00360 [Planctomycetota bacterium]
MQSRLLVFGVLTSILGGCTSIPKDYSVQLDEWQRLAPGFEHPESWNAPDSASYSSWRQEAITNNPQARSKWQLWRAAIEQVPQVTALADPKLNLGVFLQELETRNGPAQGKLGLNQSFPWFGTLDARGRAALSMADAAHHELNAVYFQLEAELQVVVSQKQLLESSIAIKRAHLELLSAGEEIVRIRWRDGQANQALLVKAQVELAKTEDQLRTLDHRHRPLDALLRAVLGRDSQAPIEWPEQSLEVAGIDLEVFISPVGSPLLAAARSRLAAGKASLLAAEKGLMPGFSLGLEWTTIGSDPALGSGSGDDAVAIGVGIEIPLRQAPRRARVSAARAKLAAAAADLSATEQQLRADFESLLFEREDAASRLALYRDGLVSKGNQAVTTALAAYRTGEGSFISYLDAARSLLVFELAQARAESELTSANARILALCGIRSSLLATK